MDSRIIGLAIAIVIIILLVWFLKSDNVVAKLLGFVGKVIVFVIIAALVIFLILKLIPKDNIEAPGMGTNEQEQANASVEKQDDNSELSDEYEYVVTIRQKDVVVTNNIIGDATYSEKFCTEEEITNKLRKIAIKTPTVKVVDDYADYDVYSLVMDELIASGIPEEKIIECSEGIE